MEETSQTNPSLCTSPTHHRPLHPPRQTIHGLQNTVLPSCPWTGAYLSLQSPFSLALSHHLNCYPCSKESPGNPSIVNPSLPHASSSQCPPSVLLHCLHGCLSYLIRLIEDTQPVEVKTWTHFIFQMTAADFVPISSFPLGSEPPERCFVLSLNASMTSVG